MFILRKKYDKFINQMLKIQGKEQNICSQLKRR